MGIIIPFNQKLNNVHQFIQARSGRLQPSRSHRDASDLIPHPRHQAEEDNMWFQSGKSGTTLRLHLTNAGHAYFHTIKYRFNKYRTSSIISTRKYSTRKTLQHPVLSCLFMMPVYSLFMWVLLNNVTNLRLSPAESYTNLFLFLRMYGRDSEHLEFILCLLRFFVVLEELVVKY